MDKLTQIRPFRAMLHPAWVLGLFVLVTNDHLLKLSEHAGWATGKLSDFAGLLIAPVLLAAIVGVKTRRGVLASAAVISFVFTLINTWTTFAAGWDATLSMIYPFQTTVDPTDLIALASVPLGLWLFGPVMESRGTQRPSRVLLQYALATAGGLASLATSPPPCEDCFCDDCEWEQTMNAPYSILNMSRELQIVRVRMIRPQIQFDCSLVSLDPSLYLTNSAFGPATKWLLQSGQEIPIDPINWSSGNSAAFPDGCAAVLIQSDTLPDTIVFVAGNPPQKSFVLDPDIAESFEPAANTLVIRGDYTSVEDQQMKAWRFRTDCGDRADWCEPNQWAPAAEIPTGARYTWEAVGPTAFMYPQSTLPPTVEVPQICQTPGPEASFYWSSPLPYNGVTVTGVEYGVDGCHKVFMGERSWWLCAPRPAVELLVPGPEQTVTLSQVQEEGTLEETLAMHVTIRSTTTDETKEFQIRFSKGYEIRDFDLTASPREGCNPVPADCSQAPIPVDVTLAGQPLPTGEFATLGELSFARRIMLVRAARTPVVDLECQPASDPNSTYYEAVLVTAISGELQ